MGYVGHVDLRHTSKRAHIISDGQFASNHAYWSVAFCGETFSDFEADGQRGKGGKPICLTCLRAACAELRRWDRPAWKQDHPDWTKPSTPLGRQRRDMEALRALVESEGVR